MPDRSYGGRVAVWRQGAANDPDSNPIVRYDYGPVQTLFRHIPPSVINRDPGIGDVMLIQSDRSLFITVEGTNFSIEDTTGDGNDVPPISLDLRYMSLNTLCTAIGALSAQRIYAENTHDDVFALRLTDGRYSYQAGESISLQGWGSDTWRFFYPLAAAIDRTRREIEQSLRALDLRQTPDAWLEVWGEYLGLPRLTDESSATYRTRLLYTSIRPRSNGRAIELLLRDGLGVVATVTDAPEVTFVWGETGLWAGGGAISQWAPANSGKFIVTVSDAGEYTDQELRALIRTYQAAGTEFEIVHS